VKRLPSIPWVYFLKKEKAGKKNCSIEIIRSEAGFMIRFLG
jgi:hypothetical protein